MKLSKENATNMQEGPGEYNDAKRAACRNASDKSIAKYGKNCWSVDDRYWRQEFEYFMLGYDHYFVSGRMRDTDDATILAGGEFAKAQIIKAIEEKRVELD